MKFAHPLIFNWLWCLIPWVGFAAWSIRRRRRIMEAYATRELIAIIAPSHNPKREWIRWGLILTAFVLIVTALAGPRMGFRWEKTTQKGVDVMVALDCSQSMMATDIAPNRLERAKREILDFLRKVESDRVGLVAFSGQALLQCPLTLDHGAFQVFLKVLNPGYLPVGGSNLPAAIQAAYSGFDPETDTEKAIILITDGENTAGDLIPVADEMAKQGVRIFSIGVGEASGAPVPDEKGGFKKDGNQNIVMSRVDMADLETLADKTNGMAVRSVAGDMDLDRIYLGKIKGGMERKELEQGRRKVWEQRFQWVLFPAILLLFWELFLDLPRTPGSAAASLGGKPSPSIKMGIWIGLMLIFGVGRGVVFANEVKRGMDAYGAGAYDQAETHFIKAQLESPDDPRLYYNIGTAAYGAQRYDQALKQFTRAAESGQGELRRKSLFNKGNTQYRQNDLVGAIDTYGALLKEFPDDNQTRENLEFVKKKLEEEQTQPQNSDGKGSQDKESDKKEKNSSPSEQSDPHSSKKDGGNSSPGNKEDGAPPKDEQNPGDDKESKAGKAGANPQDAANPSSKDNEAAPASAGPGDSDQEGPEKSGQGNLEQINPNQAAMDNRLNRLEDKPGMALTPVGDVGTIQKDW